METKQEKSAQKGAQAAAPAAETKTPAEEKRKVVAISLAPPGHYSGFHYWQSGQPTYALLTPAQEKMVRADKRLQILEGTIENAVAEADVLQAIAADHKDDKILAEAERIIKRRKERESSAHAGD